MSWPFHLLLATFPGLFINQNHWSDVVCHTVLPKTHRSKYWPDSALYTTHHHISFTDDLNIININLLLLLGPETGFFWLSSLQDISVSPPGCTSVFSFPACTGHSYVWPARDNQQNSSFSLLETWYHNLLLLIFSDSWSRRLKFLVNSYLFYSCDSIFPDIIRMLLSAFPLIPSNEKIKRWASCELISDYSYLLCWNSAVYHEAMETNSLVPQKSARLILIHILYNSLESGELSSNWCFQGHDIFSDWAV